MAEPLHPASYFVSNPHATTIMPSVPRTLRQGILMLPLALGLGCDEPKPEPRPGRAVATGGIETFTWLGPSDGLAYLSWNRTGGMRLRMVELDSDASADVGILHWFTPPAAPRGGEAVVYYGEPDPHVPELMRILRATLDGSRDTVKVFSGWLTEGLAVSPDQSRIAYGIYDTVVVSDLGTGEEWPMPGAGPLMSFSPGGDRLLVYSPWMGSELTLLEIGTGALPVEVEMGWEEYGGESPAGPPLRWDDSRPLLMTGRQDRTVVVHDLLAGTSVERTRLPGAAHPNDLAWSQDGDRLVYRTAECVESQGRPFSFEPECIEWALRIFLRPAAGPDEEVALVLSPSDFLPLLHLSLSPDGTRLAYISPSWDAADRTLYLVELD